VRRALAVTLWVSAGLALAAAAPALAAQPQQPDLSRERTGPQAAPPPRPAYAQPAPVPLAPPSTPAAAPPTPLSTSDIGTPLSAIEVTEDKAATPARPPPRWLPPQEPALDLKLEHGPGEALDAAWVRRQFALNGLPAGGAGKALALVQLVNRGFLSAGFVNSGVVVRPGAAPGVLSLRVVYGGLVAPAPGQSAVEVIWTNGHRRGLDAGYVRDRLPAAEERPLSILDLERDFRKLAEDPAIRTVNADLRPGARPGEASLELSVLPQDRFDAYVTYANNRSPAVGEHRVAIGGSMRNAVVAGDVLSAEFGRTSGLDDGTIAYAAPVFSPRNAISLRGTYDDAAVTDPVLEPLGIAARERLVEGAFTRKLIDSPLLPAAEPGRWTPARTLTVGIGAAWRETKSELFGQPFSFAPGAVNGRAAYTVLRLTGDYLSRNVDQVFAASLTTSIGLEGTKSDVAGLNNPDPNFFAVLGQFNYARRLAANGLELRVRLSGQWANGVLYSGERFGVGGEATVRGYRENILLADRGLAGTVELAQPLRLSPVRGGARRFNWDALVVSAFLDGAVVRDAKPPQPDPNLSSIGASIAWAPTEAFFAQVTYAKYLKFVDAAGASSLQDKGWTFRVTMRPLKFWL
jgi:hemolysin activation/secretion protein